MPESTVSETSESRAEAKSCPSIAIACQGGGSHTAFTAGFLMGVIEQEIIHPNTCDLVGLSGTSGGAICALLSWYGLMTGGKEEAIELLEEFWETTTADSPWEILANNWAIGMVRAQSYFGEINLNPYANPASKYAQRDLKKNIKKFVDFDKVPELFEKSCPMLLMGAVNVTNGEFKIFKDGEITIESVLASAALPTIFEAVNRDGYVYWDGLLSQNPPIRDLPQTGCDEIWVVQINHQTECHEEPRTMKEILDRRNELSGNLSLNQEIFYIEKINEMIREGVITDSDYKIIDVKQIELKKELDRASKFDRSKSFINEMIELGKNKARERCEELSC